MSRLAPDLSPSVVRMLSRPRPRWRGVSHRWAFVASLPVGVLEVVLAQGGNAKVAMAFFAFGASFMFGVSALVHLRPWPPARQLPAVTADNRRHRRSDASNRCRDPAGGGAGRGLGAVSDALIVSDRIRSRRPSWR